MKHIHTLRHLQTAHGLAPPRAEPDRRPRRAADMPREPGRQTA